MASINGFVNRDSIIHRLNPSLKFLGFLLLIVMIFLPLGFFGQIILLIIAISLWLMAKLPWRLMSSILKSMIVMAVILFVVNWIAYNDPGAAFDLANRANPIGGGWSLFEKLNQTQTLIGTDGQEYLCVHGWLWGGQVQGFTLDVNLVAGHNSITGYGVDGTPIYLLYDVPWYALSSQVIIFMVYVTLKIFLMIVMVTILTTTTTNVQLAFAIEDILNPFKILKIPVNEWAMTISIAIRFVPSLLDESQRILKAQASRGVDFSNGNISDKTKSLVSLVVPMFSIAFLKADDLANAMEARSYNPRYARTRYRFFTVTWLDWVIYGFLALILGIFIMFVSYSILFVPFGTIEALLLFGS